VTILAPYVPPVPHTQALATISFAGDPRRPDRVDNEGKAALDGIALSLQQAPDAKLVIVGEANAKEQAKTAKGAAVCFEAQACQGLGFRGRARRQRQGLSGDREGH